LGFYDRTPKDGIPSSPNKASPDTLYAPSVGKCQDQTLPVFISRARGGQSGGGTDGQTNAMYKYKYKLIFLCLFRGPGHTEALAAARIKRRKNQDECKGHTKNTKYIRHPAFPSFLFRRASVFLCVCKCVCRRMRV